MSLLYPKTADPQEQAIAIKDAQTRLAAIQQRLGEHAHSWMKGYARDRQLEQFYQVEFVGCLLGQMAYEVIEDTIGDKERLFTTVEAQSWLETTSVGGCMYDAVRIALDRHWVRKGYAGAPSIVNWNDDGTRTLRDVLDLLGKAQAVLSSSIPADEEVKEPA